MDVCLDETSSTGNISRRQVLVWLAVVSGAVGLAVCDGWTGWLNTWAGGYAHIGHPTLVLLLLAMICEFVDATIGMGYGTSLTPILLLLGYPIHTIVPAAVLSQLAGNLSAAFFHHRFGNVDFLNDTKARNTGLILGGVGLVVAMTTVFITIRMPSDALKPIVSLVVIALGVFLLFGSRLRIAFRWRNISILALIAAFNKAFTGGGYGPLVCGGQVLAGLNVRAAVASTALAEAVVCLSIVAAYLMAGVKTPLDVLLPLVAGSLLSTPASALALRKMPVELVRKCMGISVLLLGTLSLLKLIKGV